MSNTPQTDALHRLMAITHRAEFAYEEMHRHARHLEEKAKEIQLLRDTIGCLTRQRDSMFAKLNEVAKCAMSEPV